MPPRGPGGLLRVLPGVKISGGDAQRRVNLVTAPRFALSPRALAGRGAHFSADGSPGTRKIEDNRGASVQCSGMEELETDQAEPAPLSLDMARSVEFWPLEQIEPYDKNPRTHSEDQVAGIAASIISFGFNNPILVRAGTIVAGHGRLRAATKIERESPGTFAEGVPVIDLSHLSERKARAYLIADNRLAELAGWDEGLLKLEMESLELDVDELAGVGFTEDELAKMFEDDAGEAQPPSPEPKPAEPRNLDEFDGDQVEPRAKPGDVWELGQHTITCGDSTDLDIVRGIVKLSGRFDCVITDPPYAIYGSSTGVGSDVADDRMVRPFFKTVLKVAERALNWFGHAYVFCDWRSWPSWWDTNRGVPNLSVKNLLVWDKKSSGLGCNYANSYELAGFFHRIPPKDHVFAKRGEQAGIRVVHCPNVLRFGRTGQGPGFEAESEERERFHNAQKPVELLRTLVRNSATDECGRVFDGFLGSGSTLLACELEGRECHGIEAEPKWVDVAIGRWEKLTGKTAVLRNESEE